MFIGMFRTAKKRYERQLAAAGSKRKSSEQLSSGSCKLTRSKTVPFNKDRCFFCDGEASYLNPWHKVLTGNAGHSLYEAIEKKGDEKVKVKLSTPVDSHDAHAIDIIYHKRCWASNVTHVLRRMGKCPEYSTVNIPDEIAAKIEFISMTEKALTDRDVLNVATLQEVYESVMSANNVNSPTCSRKTLKQLLLSEIPEIEFHKPVRVCESERVSIKKTRDAAIHLAENAQADVNSDMKTLYDAAAVLRKAIKKCQSWNFSGSLDSITEKHLPKELYSFYRWVVQGPKHVISAEKSIAVHRRAMSLAQSTVAMFLTDCQVSNKKSEILRSTCEMPQQLAVGLAIHQANRSKQMIIYFTVLEWHLTTTES